MPFVPLTPEYLKTATLATIAGIIAGDWPKMYFGAVPYVQAMSALQGMNDTYGAEDARSIVAYGLANMQTYRGPIARMVKAELNRRLKA